jgi:hypothetical protein
MDGGHGSRRRATDQESDCASSGEANGWRNPRLLGGRCGRQGHDTVGSRHSRHRQNRRCGVCGSAGQGRAGRGDDLIVPADGADERRERHGGGVKPWCHGAQIRDGRGITQFEPVQDAGRCRSRRGSTAAICRAARKYVRPRRSYRRDRQRRRSTAPRQRRRDTAASRRHRPPINPGEPGKAQYGSRPRLVAGSGGDHGGGSHNTAAPDLREPIGWLAIGAGEASGLAIDSRGRLGRVRADTIGGRARRQGDRFH